MPKIPRGISGRELAKQLNLATDTRRYVKYKNPALSLFFNLLKSAPLRLCVRSIRGKPKTQQRQKGKPGPDACLPKHPIHATRILREYFKGGGR